MQEHSLSCKQTDNTAVRTSSSTNNDNTSQEEESSDGIKDERTELHTSNQNDLISSPSYPSQKSIARKLTQKMTRILEEVGVAPAKQGPLPVA